MSRSQPIEQSQVVELVAAGAQDLKLAPPAELVFRGVIPKDPANGAGPRAGETGLQGSQPVHPSCDRSSDHGRA